MSGSDSRTHDSRTHERTSSHRARVVCIDEHGLRHCHTLDACVSFSEDTRQLSLPIYCIYDSDMTHCGLRSYLTPMGWRRLSQCYLVLVLVTLIFSSMGPCGPEAEHGYRALAGVEIPFVRTKDIPLPVHGTESDEDGEVRKGWSRTSARSPKARTVRTMMAWQWVSVV
jgi:hypothetical protein